MKNKITGAIIGCALLISIYQKNQTVALGLEIKDVPVLQQNSATLWAEEGSDGQGAIFDKNIKWRHVREEDGINCGYHAFKNVRLVLDGLQHHKNPFEDQTLKGQLMDSNLLHQDMAFQVSQVYDARLAQIRDELIRKKIMHEGDDDKLTAEFLKANKKNLTLTRDFINANDGHVKTETLFGNEIEKFCGGDGIFSCITDNLVIVEYDPGIPGIMNESFGSEVVQGRLKDFNDARSDILGIIWNEPNFNHWVGYVADKKPDGIALYRLNSIAGKIPPHENRLVYLLKN